MSPTHPTAETPTTQRQALVIGAGSAFGLETAFALKARGWSVEGLIRNPAALRQPHPYAALHASDVRAAGSLIPTQSAGTVPQVLVYAANPPYPAWARDAMPMLEAALEVAVRAGAMFVFPGNIYNFGADAGTMLRETAAQNPATKKGAIRKRMEARLKQAADTGMDVRIIRAPDFFGPRQGGSWFRDAILAGAKASPKKLAYPGNPAIGHSWAYLPDLGEATARLIEAPLAQGFNTFGFPGHFVEPGAEMLHLINAALGKKLPFTAMPWGMMRLVAPFSPMIRELFEMRYLWDIPHRIDGAPLEALIGPLRLTPLDQAVKATVTALFPKT
jgi:nucleoside-diphosphate-sugar epimerase